MIESRVHAELMRLGGYQKSSAIASLLNMDSRYVAFALGRLKDKGAVEKVGDRITSRWKALDVVVEDGRQYNRGIPGPRAKKQVEAVAAYAEEMRQETVKPKNEEPVHCSALAQALAWCP